MDIRRLELLRELARTATDVGGESGATVTGFLDFGKIMGAALVVAGIETVLVTALCTLLVIALWRFVWP